LAHYETCSASTVPKFGLWVPLGASGLFFWIFRFIIAEALKTTARRETIGASTPVFGFRPMRWPFSRTVNDPNDDNFTISHRAMVSTISFNTRSTKADDSVRVKSPNHTRALDRLDPPGQEDLGNAIEANAHQRPDRPDTPSLDFPKMF
jgi:hypothetical protein